MLAYELKGVIDNSQNLILLRKYLKKVISVEEQINLLAAFNFSNTEDLNLFLQKYYLKRLEINRNYPELSKMQDSKPELLSASLKVLEKYNKPIHVAMDCWVYLLAAQSALAQYCMIYQPDNWENCMWEGMAIILATYGFCMVTADPQ